MYKLILTSVQRQAIDWVGYRYSHGDRLREALGRGIATNLDGGEIEWDEPGAIKFLLPEHVAWEICELIEEDGLACFGEDLVRTMLELQRSVV